MADRWLVIGAGGLVGGHVRAALSERATVSTCHVTPVEGAARLDITDRAAVDELVGTVAPAVVVLAAAEAHVERCEADPVGTRRTNVEAVRFVAEAASRAAATLVYFSSEYVFDGSKTSYVETDATRPVNEYGRQKVEAEGIVATVPRYLVCRTSGAFGWERRRKNFVCQMLDRLRARMTFDVPSDQLVTPTPAPDLARAVIALVDDGRTGIYHVCGPAVLARPAFARLVADTFDLPNELIRERPSSEIGLLAQRPRCGLRDDRLTATLGWRLTDPATALRSMRECERPWPASS